jgi:molybdopterin synthase catalytic subunit
MIELTSTEIDTQRILKDAYRADCGAVVLFLGTTRQWTKDRETDHLVYDAYQAMAVSKLEELERAAIDRWPVKHVAIVHRLGRVDIGKASVAVVVASPHREAAFEAAKWLIDELKRQVPIWKQEHWTSQEPSWIHPPSSPGNPTSNPPT